MTTSLRLAITGLIQGTIVDFSPTTEAVMPAINVET
jgi:hypothetical protein